MRADPKDRRELAARIAQVTSGELSGAALVAALEGIVRDDPRNGQAQLRLGYARLQAGDCARAEPAFHAAAAAGLPSRGRAISGLATCLGQRSDLAGAERALAEARRIEPDNPSVIANLGLLQASKGDLPAAIQSLNSGARRRSRRCTRRASTSPWPTRRPAAGPRPRPPRGICWHVCPPTRPNVPKSSGCSAPSSSSRNPFIRITSDNNPAFPRRFRTAASL